MSCHYRYILSWCITPLIVDIFIYNLTCHAIVDIFYRGALIVDVFLSNVTCHAIIAIFYRGASRL